MSQSPEAAHRLQRYEDGWETINRLIREGGSWSGFERNCLHLGVGDGAFVDISAASGVDFIEDGRAWCRLDVDRDGRPDLLLRNRNAPQLRLLRNRWNGSGRSLWIRLEGRGANIDAIGGRVTLVTDRGTRIKEITAGSGYLSQHGRWLCFGLGSQGAVDEVRIRWPDGEVESLGPLQADRRWHVVQGEAPRAERFTPRAPAGEDSWPAISSGSDRTDTGRSPTSIETWLLDPLPAPPLRGHTAKGEEIDLESLRGRPVFVQFFSRNCAVCRRELPALLEARTSIEKLGARVALVSVDVSLPGKEALEPVARSGDQPLALQIDSSGLLAWNVAHRHLYNWRRDLVVPTTFLLDEQGRIVKVYRGAVPPERFLDDRAHLPRNPHQRIDRALPVAGTIFRARFRRDLFALGNAFQEAGFPELARDCFASRIDRGVDDLNTLFNYALVSSRIGDNETARETYRRVLSRNADFHDARNNLGALEARSGNLERARGLFETVVEANPLHTEAVLNLAKTYIETGDLRAAARVCRRALELDPDSSPLLRMLGSVLNDLGERDAALTALARAVTIDPLDASAWTYLGVVHLVAEEAEEALEAARHGLEADPTDHNLLNLAAHAHRQLGDHEAAVRLWNQAIASEPRFDSPYLGLAELQLDRGRPDIAREVLERLLVLYPGHRKAQELLERAGQ